MDAKGMNSLDVRFLVRELQTLKGGKVRKIYHYSDALLFEFFLPGRGGAWLRIEPKRAFLADGKEDSVEPTQFCMLLRKHIMGNTLHAIEQIGFDRIFRLAFNDHALIVELLFPGNIILCEREGRIVMPLEVQRWKDRSVVPKEHYTAPPIQRNPFSASANDLELLFAESGKPFGSFLAVSLGLGGTYAQEICARMGVPGTIDTCDGDLLKQTLEEIDRSFTPMQYPDVVTPFPLTGKSGEGMSTFSEGIGRFSFDVSAPKKPDRTEWIMLQQAQAKKRLEEKYQERQERAQLLQRHLGEVETVFHHIKTRTSWKDVKEKIPGIDEKVGHVRMTFEGTAFTLDFRKTAFENVRQIFDDGKKAREKLEGLAVASAKTIERPATQHYDWYEQYRWFRTSDGFLVIGGKSATQNEEVFRKHMHPQDRVLHADIPGASLLVVQSEGREVTEQALKEAAAFSGTQSRAWNRGLGAVDVYAVKPEQVSKSPPSGMALSKGSFYITGERKWFRNMPMQIAATVEDGKILARPIEGAKEPFVVLVPGKLTGRKLAETVQKSLLQVAGKEKGKMIKNMPLSAFERVLPNGANLSQSGSRRK